MYYILFIILLLYVVSYRTSPAHLLVDAVVAAAPDRLHVLHRITLHHITLLLPHIMRIIKLYYSSFINSAPAHLLVDAVVAAGPHHLRRNVLGRRGRRAGDEPLERRQVVVHLLSLQFIIALLFYCYYCFNCYYCCYYCRCYYCCSCCYFRRYHCCYHYSCQSRDLY